MLGPLNSVLEKLKYRTKTPAEAEKRTCKLNVIQKQGFSVLFPSRILHLLLPLHVTSLVQIILQVLPKSRHFSHLHQGHPKVQAVVISLLACCNPSPSASTLAPSYTRPSTQQPKRAFRNVNQISPLPWLKAIRVNPLRLKLKSKVSTFIPQGSDFRLPLRVPLLSLSPLPTAC